MEQRVPPHRDQREQKALAMSWACVACALGEEAAGAGNELGKNNHCYGRCKCCFAALI